MSGQRAGPAVGGISTEDVERVEAAIRDRVGSRASEVRVTVRGGGLVLQGRSRTHHARQLAQQAGVSNPYLSQVERGLRKPSAEILQQIAKALQISAEALYAQAGFLERRQAGPVVDAIHADPDLTERQKQVLLDIYSAFRRENTAAAEEAPARSEE